MLMRIVVSSAMEENFLLAITILNKRRAHFAAIDRATSAATSTIKPTQAKKQSASSPSRCSRLLAEDAKKIKVVD